MNLCVSDSSSPSPKSCKWWTHMKLFWNLPCGHYDQSDASQWGWTRIDEDEISLSASEFKPQCGRWEILCRLVLTDSIKAKAYATFHPSLSLNTARLHGTTIKPTTRYKSCVSSLTSEDSFIKVCKWWQYKAVPGLIVIMLKIISIWCKMARMNEA